VLLIQTTVKLKIMKATRTLNDNTTLTVTVENGEYNAAVSSDTRSLGFEGDSGEVKEGETADSIADELEMWMNDNINS
jgi:hypothetical protein